MQTTFKKIATAVAAGIAAVALLVGVSACATTEKIDMTKVTSVIDVRTAEEFATGHLTGAINIDVDGQNFVAEVSKLDTAGTYVVYCHSGHRAGIALDAMKSMGFANVTNAGGLDAAAAATGLTIVQ